MSRQGEQLNSRSMLQISESVSLSEPVRVTRERISRGHCFSTRFDGAGVIEPVSLISRRDLIANQLSATRDELFESASAVNKFEEIVAEKFEVLWKKRGQVFLKEDRIRSSISLACNLSERPPMC